ncbi:MAG: tRNA (adenosine(37)-N6)-dimethylallyltransferase MiaA [Gammaproteobacteria bacterium]|nr:tRNA (adenosine(37)-N6)-dimethylallyltransferase MiaA [Gammaproteobacteria bacterium]
MSYVDQPIDLLVVLGPTASGKTRLGVELARLLEGEILSADSRQVYKGLDIGSGKDVEEYGEIPYHLIDIVDPGYEFNLFAYQRHFFEAFSLVQSRGKLPILVGGTGMYIDAVINNYELAAVPENSPLREELSTLDHDQLIERLKIVQTQLHNTTDLKQRSRLIRAIEIAESGREVAVTPGEREQPLIVPLVLGIKLPRPELRRRITQRLRTRLENGLIEEVAALHQQGLSFDTLNFYGLEYRYVAQFVTGKLNRNDMYQKLNSAIHQFAKKQETWFRRMEKRGTIIHWLDGNKNLYTQALPILEQHGLTSGN